MSKLWKKEYFLNKQIEEFTVGNDYLLDQKLVPFDCQASIAHATMLKKIGVLSDTELKKLIKGLHEIVDLHSKGKFEIKPEEEDCHTAIENYLTKKYGDVGKKIHTARSRNDQVLAALRLYEISELTQIKALLLKYITTVKKAAKKYSMVPIPGYTHMQKAMPSSIKLWLGAYADSAQDSVTLLDSVLQLFDQSPLGSAAGFGVPILKIDKKMTAAAMGFSNVMQNPIHAHMSRGKFESSILHVLSHLMLDLNKLATDLILFGMQEFGFVSLPDEFCTGSSIMPQKKNPDALELIRAKYHVVLGEEFKVKSMIGNLLSGYNRDLQLTKEPVITSLEVVKDSLSIMSLLIKELQINEEKCTKALTKGMYATEEAYKLVAHGTPFREAYTNIAKKFEN